MESELLASNSTRPGVKQTFTWSTPFFDVSFVDIKTKKGIHWVHQIKILFSLYTNSQIFEWRVHLKNTELEWKLIVICHHIISIQWIPSFRRKLDSSIHNSRLSFLNCIRLWVSWLMVQKIDKRSFCKVCHNL